MDNSSKKLVTKSDDVDIKNKDNYWMKVFFFGYGSALLIFGYLAYQEGGLIGLSSSIKSKSSSSASKSSSSTSKSSSSTSRKKECRCCGKRFTHSGYKIGYGETAYGNIDKIGVQPGPYDSEYCAFLCEHMDGLGK